MNKVKHSGQFKKGLAPWNKGRKASEETKRKLSLSHMGKIPSNKGVKRGTPWNKGKKMPEISGAKSHLWKGGITPVNYQIRHSVEYKLWRESVFERDNFTCIWCNARNGNGKKIILHADHIKPFAFYPELRFAIDNGRTLCIDCHKKTDSYATKAIMNYKNKN